MSGAVQLSSSMNKTKLSVFCLTGSTSAELTCPRAYPSLPFSNQPFFSCFISISPLPSPLALILSDPSPFLLLLSNLCSPTVSFHSSAPGWPCPPLWCHSASILKANWKKDHEDPHGLKLWRLLLQCKKRRGLTEEKHCILIIMAQNTSHILQGSLNAIMDFSKRDLGGCRICAT